MIPQTRNCVLQETTQWEGNVNLFLPKRVHFLKQSFPPDRTLVISRNIDMEPISDFKTRADGRNISHSKSTAVTRSFLRVWLWEVLAWALAVSCLTAASVILMLYDHQPLRELPLKVKLTTALSILANIIEAALVIQLAACLGQIMWTRFYRGHGYLNEVSTFGEASRGPLGAFRLLFMGRPGYEILP